MAFTQLAPQANRISPTAVPDLNDPAGTPGISPAVTVPFGTQVVTFRMTSSSWPTGTGNYLLFSLDVSYDGGATWRDLAPPAQVDEGARSKVGEMPSISWAVGQEYPPVTGDVLVRSRFAIPAGTLRFGLEWELIS